MFESRHESTLGPIHDAHEVAEPFGRGDIGYVRTPLAIDLCNGQSSQEVLLRQTSISHLHYS